MCVCVGGCHITFTAAWVFSVGGVSLVRPVGHVCMRVCVCCTSTFVRTSLFDVSDCGCFKSEENKEGTVQYHECL